MNAGELPPFIGIRIKPFTEELARAQHPHAGHISDGTRREIARRAAEALSASRFRRSRCPMKSRHSPTSARVWSRCSTSSPARCASRLMVETSQSILNERGEVNLLPLVSAARGRCVAAHFGPYDYTSSLGIAAPRQAGERIPPPISRARSCRSRSRKRGIRIADGPLNILPIPPYRAAKTAARSPRARSRKIAPPSTCGWKLQFDNVRRALEFGFYQGWDLHPAQLPGALCGRLFFLSGKSRFVRGALAQFRREGRAGDAHRPSVRRCRHGAGSAELFPTSRALRRADRGRSRKRSRDSRRKSSASAHS